MKVAAIIDCYTVAVTRKDGPYLGLGDILAIGGHEVIDPETRELLGVLPALKVKVTECYEKFVVAETYRLAGRDQNPEVTVNIGDDVRCIKELF